MRLLLENIDGIIMVVYCFLTGIIVAFIISLFTKGIYGRLVDALVTHGADSPDTAKALKEIGIKKSRFLYSALSRRTTLSSLVSCENNDAEADERRYYILPQNKIKAQAIYGRDKISLVSIIVAIAVFVAALFLLQYVVPKLI